MEATFFRKISVALVYKESNIVRKVTITYLINSMVFFLKDRRQVNTSPQNRKPINATILNSCAEKMTLTVEGGLMLLVNLAAFTGNLLMCFILYKKPRFHTTANTFILSLTICHVFSSCLVMPFIAGSLLTGEPWPFGQTLCDIQKFLFPALTWASLQLLTIMVVRRYLNITQLVFYNKWFSLNRSIGIIVTIWVFDVVVLNFLTILGGTMVQFSPKRSLSCTGPLSRENQTVNIFNTVVTLVFYTALLIISIMALYAIRTHKATFRARRRVTLVDMRRAAEAKKTDKVLLALTTEILLIWMPIIIIKLVEFPTQPIIAIPHQAHLASTFLWFAVPVLHPVTYGALYRPFSREVLRVLPSIRLRQNKVHAEHTI